MPDIRYKLSTQRMQTFPLYFPIAHCHFKCFSKSGNEWHSRGAERWHCECDSFPHHQCANTFRPVEFRRVKSKKITREGFKSNVKICCGLRGIDVKKRELGITLFPFFPYFATELIIYRHAGDKSSLHARNAFGRLRYRRV